MSDREGQQSKEEDAHASSGGESNIGATLFPTKPWRM